MPNPLTLLSRTALQLTALAGFCCFALAIIVCPQVMFFVVGAAVLANYRRRGTTANFGSARWANQADIAAANLIGHQHGLPLGYADSAAKPSFKRSLRGLFFSRNSELACRTFLGALGVGRMFAGQPLRHADGVHSAIFAAPGAGKTTALILPALFLDPTPAFVIDPKGEIASIVAKHRQQRYGLRTIILDPYDILKGGTETYNPLSEIDSNSPGAVEEILDLSSALVVKTGKETDSHWVDSAELLLSALTAFVVAHLPADKRNLSTVQHFIGNTKHRLGALEIMGRSNAMQGMLSKMGDQVGQFKEKELSSVITSTLRQLNFLLSPAIAHLLSKSSFDMAEFIDGKADIFLILPPDRMRGPQAGVLRLIFTSIVRSVFRAGVDNSRRLNFYIDEAACLGQKLPALDQALAVGRGFGVKVCLVYQSMGQLLASGDQGAAQTLLSCLNCTVFLGSPCDTQTADHIEKMTGDTTIQLRSEQTGTSYSSSQGAGQAGSHSRSGNSSCTYSEQGRKLIFASETYSIRPGEAIVFLPGKCPPLFVTMRRWFEDPACCGRFRGLRRFFGQLRVLFLSVLFLTLSSGLLAYFLLVLDERAKAPPVRYPPAPVMPAYPSNFVPNELSTGAEVDVPVTPRPQRKVRR